MFNKLISWFLQLERPSKRLLLVAVDFVMIMAMLWAAFSIRLDVVYQPPLQQYWIFLAAPLIATPIFIRFGLYRAIVRYIGFQALWAVFQAVFLYTAVWSLLVLMAKVDGVPRSVYLLNFIFAMFFIAGSRMVGRWVFGGFQSKIRGVATHQPANVVIYGAGEAGVQLSVALSLGREMRPVAFIDDDKSLHHFHAHGLRVYPPTSLGLLIERKKVSEVLLAIPSTSRSRRNQIIATLEPYSVHVRTIPGVSELAQGKVNVEDIREVDIADLLGREKVEPDLQLLNANIKGKSVMVTGAGGSIGSELCRQIVTHEPKCLILFEISEFQLYSIHKELRKAFPHIDIYPILGSVSRKKRVREVCQAFDVQTIYHAAAYKHVPMVESNPGEGIQNNILGTLCASEAAIESGVETFVLISTDKAVRPTNVMGATKRFAELILQAFANSPELSKGTRFTMVRFGNVLGSSGSVVPLFREQIAHGGPVTVTDRNIIRYFMTIPEAAELVIQAGAMGQGGDVFVLDMGEPVKIVELARRMIRLSGYEVKEPETPHGDIEITFTGLRPGEKLYEELLIGDNVLTTDHSKIMRAQEEVIPWGELKALIALLKRAADADDYTLIREILQTAVSGYTPQCRIVDEITLAIEAKPGRMVNGNVVPIKPVAADRA